MKKKIEFTLPWPPSINDYYGHNKYGGVWLKPHVRKYLEYAPMIIKKKTKNFKFKSKVEITKVFCPPDNKKRDEDNLLKALNDSLTKSGIIKDDSHKYIKTGASEWIEAKKPGHVQITLEEI